MKIKINADLLPVKGQYFLFNAGTAPVVPYLPTYARQLGFSSVVVGLIYTILPIMGMLAKPLLGAVADHFRRQKMMFILCEVLVLVTFFTIQFIPEVPVESKSVAIFDCGEGESFINVCGNKSSDQCDAERITEDGSSGALHCEMACSVTNPAIFSDICMYWNVSDYCKSQRPRSGVLANDTLHITAVASLNHTTSVYSCFYFPVHKVKTMNSDVLNPSCSAVRHLTCNTYCNNTVINNMITVNEEIADVAGLYQFWLFFLLMILSWVGMAVVVSVGDAICFGMLGDQPSNFGQQRLWGAVGWGTFSILAGILVDEFSRGQTKKDYTVVFYILLVMMALDILVSSRLKYTQTKLSASIIRDVGRLFTEIRIVVFLIWTIAVGLCTAMVWQFLFWHIEDLAKSSGCETYEWVKTLQGLINGVQSFGGELPFFFLSGHILRKIGHIHAMSLVLLAFGVRFILYYFLTNPWWCLPIELFQGLTFGIFYSAMTSYASIVSPPGTEATVQGLVGASFEGIGVSIGSLIGGVLIDQYGGADTFLIFGIGSLICFVLHVIVQFWLGGKSDKLPEVGDSESPRYAAPSEAVMMLSDQQEAPVS
ncbi:major facilitator superfamily domain-containing protein 6 isoform X1 [Schistocerca americana]|uniref:major facilitator superfamily domain-containing protein 6 isoform X1 n=1 Tax=Schistocerca americana TaxID=7009 RepID=UPI001F4FB338|nr:major facilitator superfamily domain-containing protein 6 isoform X1 [Schistocerca americana]